MYQDGEKIEDIVVTKCLHLVDDNGNLRASLETCSTSGLPMLHFYDENESPRVIIGMDGVNAPHVTIMDEKRNVVANMKYRGSMNEYVENETFIGIYKNQKNVFCAGVDVNGEPFFECDGKKIV